MSKDRPIDVLIRWMTERGWNKVELAEHLDVTPQHVSNWLKRGLPTRHHQAVAELFGRSIDELVGKNINNELAVVKTANRLPKPRGRRLLTRLTANEGRALEAFAMLDDDEQKAFIEALEQAAKAGASDDGSEAVDAMKESATLTSKKKDGNRGSQTGKVRKGTRVRGDR